MNYFARLALVVALPILASGHVSRTLAQDNWKVSSGTWSTAGNWTSGVPNSSTDAFIVNGGTATIPSGVSASCGTLVVGGAASGTVQLAAGGELTGNNNVFSDLEMIGYTGSGTFNQTGGTNNCINENTDFWSGLVLGENTGSSGSYNLSGGWLSTNQMVVGDAGNGAFTQTGGTNAEIGTDETFATLGAAPGSVGSYNLSGGSLAMTQWTVGNSGNGAFTQTGGTNSTFGVVLGNNAGGSGSYNLSGGSLFTGDLPVGWSGSGAFTQTGGTISIISASGGVGLYLGVNAGSSGSYNLSGNGYLFVDDFDPEYVGLGGNGSFTQTGGTNSATEGILVGTNTGSSGSYNLSGSGYLAGPTEYVGYSGSGAFTQSGGTNSVGSLTLGYTAGSNGTYNLSGSGYLAAGYEYVGSSGKGSFTQTGGTNSAFDVEVGSGTGSGSYNLGGSGYLATTLEGIGGSGSGSFTQTGGTNSVSDMLFLSENYGIGGSYSLSGGYCLVGEENIGYTGSGAFTQTGGTNSATDVVLGFGVGAVGSYSLSGSGYLASGTEYIGNSGSGAFTQSGGTNSAQGGLILSDAGGGGSYSLSGGSLLAGYITDGNYASGTFTQTGGTASVGGSIYVGANAPATGSYSLSGSGCLFSAGAEYIGFGGSGTFTQTGGTNSTAASVLLGYSAGSSGAYSLSAGYLTAATEYAGYSGSGAFTQSGGTNLVANNLYLGYNAGGNGSYNLSGGSLMVSGAEYVGYSGSGAFTQTGETNSAPAGLFLGYNPGSSGSYNLNGGSLAAYYLSDGNSGNGAFAQSGGTDLVATSAYLGYNAGGSGSYNLGGSGYLAAATEYVGYSGSGAFTQSSGTNSTGGLYLAVNPGAFGSYSLAGGLLSAGTICVGPNAIFSQSGGTVAPAPLLNSGTFSYAGGTFNGQLVNYGTCIFNSSFYAAEGIINYATFTAIPAGVVVGTGSGAFTLDNEGTIILAGGSLAGGQTAGSGGPIVNNGLITGYGGLTSGVGITNNAQITQSGGNLAIFAGAAGMTNLGTISLESGYQLTLSGSALSNLGTVNLNSSIVAGSGLLINAGGNVEGPGTISAAFENSVGMLSVPPGTTNITQPFQNSGSIQLWGFTADLTGGSIANAGSIQGNGLVANSVNNTGTIESIEGTLTLSGSLRNSAGGLLAVDDGSKLVVSSGLAANLGTINLTGGIFDNNGFALSNSAEISGYGTFRSGGLANYGAVIFTGAASTVNGPVTNAGDIDLGGTCTMVVNNGGGALLQTSGTLEMGAGASLSAGSVEIAGGILLADGPAALITAKVFYSSSSTSTYQGVLAGAGNSLTVDNPAAVLVLSGSGNSYSGGTFIQAGELVVTSPGGIESGTVLAVGSDLAAFGAVVPGDSVAPPPATVPEPGTLALVAAGAAIALMSRSRRGVQGGGSGAQGSGNGEVLQAPGRGTCAAGRLPIRRFPA